jgi:hypothetical protein
MDRRLLVVMALSATIANNTMQPLMMSNLSSMTSQSPLRSSEPWAIVKQKTWFTTLANYHNNKQHMNIHPLCYFDMSEQELQQMLQTEQETVD